MIAAHPDDETLGMGGTIAKLVAAGTHVTVAIVTDGSSAQHPTNIEARQRRNLQMRDALAILGVQDLIHGTFPDMRLDTIAHIEINNWLTTVFRQTLCDTVFTHHHGDVNRDHSRIFESTLVAARPLPGQRVKRVFSYFVNSSSEWGSIIPNAAFLPTVFVDITETIEIKLSALNAYVDEIRPPPHPRNPDAARARARTLGSEAGVDYAEAFSLVRALVD